jgi:hypothetical protein
MIPQFILKDPAAHQKEASFSHRELQPWEWEFLRRSTSRSTLGPSSRSTSVPSSVSGQRPREYDKRGIYFQHLLLDKVDNHPMNLVLNVGGNGARDHVLTTEKLKT